MTSGASSFGRRSLVFIGLMGAGKTAVGRRVAQALGMPFVDADAEIEKAAGCSISDIFAVHGEAAFRDGERRVIARLLNDRVQVLSTGGGAFLDPDTRALIRERGISIWLRADLEVLHKRTARRNHRPLLQTGNPRKILADLIERRYPVYAEADLVVDTEDQPVDQTVDKVLRELARYEERLEQAGSAT